MSDKIDRKAFEAMEYASADKTNVDFLSKPDRVGSKDVHNMLMAAGFTPGLGNIADAADALLYAAEGEFGSAALSAAAMIPFVGQAVSAKKALKVAKESGEKMVTIYRGVPMWFPSKHKLTSGKHKGKTIQTGDKMVKEGKFVGAGDFTDLKHVPLPVQDYIKNKLGRETLKKGSLWTTDFKPLARNYKQFGPKGEGRILEFEVPESYINKHGLEWRGEGIDPSLKRRTIIFEQGLPKEFLKKVHK